MQGQKEGYRPLPTIQRISRWVVLAIFVVQACGLDRKDVLTGDSWTNLVMESGRRPTDLIHRTGPTIFLLVDRNECLTCSLDVYRWAQFARGERGSLVFVLSRHPNNEEVTMLRRLRIPFEIARSVNAYALERSAPAVAVFENEKLSIRADQISFERRAALVDSLASTTR